MRWDRSSRACTPCSRARTGGRILCAFSGAKGALYDTLRKQGYVGMDRDRVPDLAGISAPVFGPDRQVAGALTLTMPASRKRASFVPAVRKAAGELTKRFGGEGPGRHPRGGGDPGN